MTVCQCVSWLFSNAQVVAASEPLELDNGEVLVADGAVHRVLLGRSHGLLLQQPLGLLRLGLVIECILTNCECAQVAWEGA